MAPSNEPTSRGAPRFGRAIQPPSHARRRVHRSRRASFHQSRRNAVRPWLLCAGLLALVACGGGDRASLEQDVRVDLAHEPPGSAPAGEPFLLGLRVSATPQLPDESVHLWWSADGDWVRLPLRPLAGTERMEAEVPPQPKGTVVRYYFTVRTPLGETLRLPEERIGSAGAPPGDYELVVRAAAAPWASATRVGAALLAVGAVALGAWTSRPRGQTPPSRAGVALMLAGVAVFLVALGSAAMASIQATGDAAREIPPAWWVALLAFLALAAAALALRGRPSGRVSRGLWVVAAVLAVVGAAAALAGLAALV